LGGRFLPGTMCEGMPFGAESPLDLPTANQDMILYS